MQRRIIGALLLATVIGFFSAAILGTGGGIICGLFVLIALIVARNL